MCDHTQQLPREQTRQVQVGAVAIGGGAPIPVQSMCNTKTTDVAATLAQIRDLAKNGCDIVRVTVPTQVAANSFGQICAASPSGCG